MPTFHKEYALLLTNTVEYKPVVDPFAPKTIIKSEWLLTLRAKNFKEKQKNIPEKIEEKQIKLNAKDAKLFLNAWEQTLKQTRYSNKNFDGLDGVNYLFFCNVNSELYGKCWSPSYGLPLLITNLSTTLCKLVINNKNSRNNYLKQARLIANEIEKEIAIITNTD